jgi:hypothetical protein
MPTSKISSRFNSLNKTSERFSDRGMAHALMPGFVSSDEERSKTGGRRMRSPMREMMRKIKFSTTIPGGDRRHYLTEEDVMVVLSRLPEETWRRLRAVHFNDRARGNRVLGYVNLGRREIAICALPPRLSFSRVAPGQRCEQFGAKRGEQWPPLAVRRFLLYDVLLHELGHLQVVNEKTKSERLRFAREKCAQEFADRWRRKLWSEHFDHPDPVHNAPVRF